MTRIAVGSSYQIPAFWQGQKKEESWNLRTELHFSNVIVNDRRFPSSVEKDDAVVVQ